MNYFSTEELRNLDIDCFCYINDIPVHFATNAGLIPRHFYSIEELAEINQNINTLDEIYNVKINQDWIEKVANENYEGEDLTLPERIDMYSRGFVRMAGRGFYSFDRIYEFEDSDRYRLVASPEECYGIPSLLKDLPVRLKEYKIGNMDFSVMDKDFYLIDEINKQSPILNLRTY